MADAPSDLTGGATQVHHPVPQVVPLGDGRTSTRETQLVRSHNNQPINCSVCVDRKKHPEGVETFPGGGTVDVAAFNRQTLKCVKATERSDMPAVWLSCGFEVLFAEA